LKHEPSRRNGKGRTLPSEAKATQAPHLDTSELDALAPHRAAVPIPPVIFTEALKPRRSFSWPSIGAALGLHCGFLLAAVLWGQGRALPPAENAIAVELVDRIGPAPMNAPADAAGSAEQEAQPTVPSLGELEQASPEAQEPARPTPAEWSAPTEEKGVSEIPLPRGRLSGMLERFRQVLAANRSEPDDLPPPPPPGKPPRAVRAQMAAGTTAGTALATLGGSPAIASAAARQIAFSIYKRRVRSRIEHNLPIGDKGAGRVAIGLRLSRSGELLSAFVLRSSGNLAIDRAAQRCVQAASPYPFPPPGVTSTQLTLSVAFLFE
jgi:TonB family protein